MTVRDLRYANTTPSLTSERWAVSLRGVLALYALVPLGLLLQYYDLVFCGEALKNWLPANPTQFLLFQLLFGTPHILASTLILTTHRDYWRHYRPKIFTMTTLLAVGFALGSLWLEYRTLYIFVAAWTVYHVLKQQYGIARSVCQLPEWAFQLLLWLSVTTGLIIYLGVFLKNSLLPTQMEWIRETAAVLTASLIGAAFVCRHLLRTGIGLWFYWANIGLVVGSFSFFWLHYDFLALVVPRLIHDLSAYYFYVTHDYNRHAARPDNALYRMARRLHLPVYVVLPLLSIGLTVLLQQYGDAWVNGVIQLFWESEPRRLVTVGLLGYLALLHYYLEGLTWQKHSPYRRYLALKT